MPTEHAKDHGAEADSGEFRCGVMWKLSGENCVYSNYNLTEDVCYHRWPSQSNKVQGHLDVTRLMVVAPRRYYLLVSFQVECF